MGILKDLQTIFGNKKDTAKPNEEAVNAPALSGTGKKVLIVEDEKLLADALEAKFKHENFEVIKAENGQQGLEMTQANNPDIILLDLMMPVMDGKTMLHKLREIPQFKHLPVIVLTNAGDIDNMRQTKMYDNASAFFIKSNINPDEIVEAVNDLI